MPPNNLDRLWAALHLEPGDWPMLTGGLQRRFNFELGVSVVRLRPGAADEYLAPHLEFGGGMVIPLGLRFQRLVISFDRKAYYIEAAYWWQAEVLIIRDITRRVCVEVCFQ